MESDLPLMKLTEEDDSLIQPFPDPSQTPSKSSFNYFTCSPLALPPSRIKSLKDSVHTEYPSSSSSESSNNKENINSNNVEIPKLGMGPIQMKRKKKGADYNLRKSLAWDKAFFTDEGILDPRELNLITGINCGRGLPSISEEGNSSFSSGNKCRNEPNHMESSKEALLKELHNKNRTPKGNKVGIHDSLHHKVTDCSKPSPASSLKRPNSYTLRTAKKESKLPKLPMSKSGSCFSATTKVSMTTRHNLIPKPPINVQKNVGLKSSLKDVNGSQSKAKTQKTTHSSSKATSLTKSQMVHIEKANSGLEMIPDRFQSCEIKDESTPLTDKNLAQLTPTIKNNSLPSGLRLPSPSLRFFDQTTISESISLQQKRSQQSNRQSGEVKPPETPRTPSGRCSVSNSVSTFCGGIHLSPSSNYIGKKGVTDSNVYSDIVRKMQYECMGSDVESHKVIEQVKGITRYEGKMGIEKIALKSDEETKDDFLLLNEEEKPHNHTAISVATSEQFIQHKEEDKSLVIHPPNAVPFYDDWLAASEITGEDVAETSVNPGCNLDVGRLESEGGPSEVFVESCRGKIGKREDDVGGINREDYSVVLHDEKRGQVNDVVKVVDDKTSPMKDVGRCNNISTHILSMVQGSVSDCKELHKPNELQDFVRIIPSMETNNYFTNIKSRHGLESCGQDLCSVIQESCLVDERAEVSKISYGEEVEPQVLQEGINKDATVLMKRSNNMKGQDKSLVKHPPNAVVPFSDECLAAIEASEEDLAQISTEQGDTKISNACTVNPQSLQVFVESQRGEIGKKEDNVAESSSLKDGPCEIATEINDYIFQEKNGNLNELETSTEMSKIIFGEEVKAQVLEEGMNKEATVLMKKSNNIKRPDKSLAIHAVPFSDEWLAAIEAAGEEILTMKCGAVQHSPPDKSIPERNPWSPVKNKASQIGPYDCTKYTNVMPSNPHLSD